MNLAASNRRIAPRVALFEAVELVLPDGESVRATALDLSETGIAVWASGDRPNGNLRVRFDPGSPGEVTAEARIAREFRSDGGAVWGLEFRDLGPSVLTRLRHRLQRSA